MLARHRFSVLTFLIAILLLGWGAFVTSINAGMAVPDWPTSFNSYSPFNPIEGWWKMTPVFAEHGHRLLGALIGFLTLVLTIWTWLSDQRQWMRRVALGALFLVILQGVLGGLRVVLISVDLAVVHTLVAQLYFSLLAAMILFVSQPWLAARETQGINVSTRMKKVILFAPLLVYLQIFLGALLRHPGVGINPFYAGLHIGTAIIVSIYLVWMRSLLLKNFPQELFLRRLTTSSTVLLGIQVSLGLLAYFVILDEKGMVRPSDLQVITNSAHLIIGALLLANTVCIFLYSMRRSAAGIERI